VQLLSGFGSESVVVVDRHFVWMLMHGFVTVQVGLPSDSKIMDLLDFALSADTVNTVRTMREVLASGVEPLSLVSQLGALITDILVGSRDMNREMRPGEGFFNRNFCKQ